MLPADPHQYLWLISWILKGVEYLAKVKARQSREIQEEFENKILDYLNKKATPSSAGIIWAEVVVKPIIQDVPFGVAFPPQVTGWQRVKAELKRFPYELRHRWRKWQNFLSEDKVDEILTKLLREERVSYDPTSERYSRKL